MVYEVERVGARHVILPLASKNPLTIRANVARLEALIAREGIDIVHARSRAPAWSAVAAARRAGVHFVTTFHNAYGAATWLKRRYNSVMARGERIIAISDFVARHVIETYGVPAHRDHASCIAASTSRASIPPAHQPRPHHPACQ